MSIRVYNTLSRSKEPFEPVRPGRVGMYVCGPTVYAPSHVGHAVGPVIFDCIKRHLTFRGYQVTWVLNVTDVEDKLIARAQAEGTTVRALSEKYAADYFDNLKRLNVTGIDTVPWATEHIDDIIRMVQALLSKGHAYEVDGDVYFDVASFPSYGRLSRRRVEELEAGARVAVDERKRHAADFALWKAAKPGEPSWPSPWGDGRPGWHIECSAMSSRYLGETFDIHGGGLDLIFPHHENEIAQSEGASGKPFVKYWLHNGLTRLADQKMSKSLGNLVTISDLLARWPGETVRFFLISTHYRQPIDFSDERIGEVARGLDAFYRTFERVKRILGRSAYEIEPADLQASRDSMPGENGGRHPDVRVSATIFPDHRPVRSPDAPAGELTADVQAARERFLASMDDDFNTAGAVGALFELNGAVNRFIERAGLETGSDAAQRDLLVWGVGTIRALGQLLGLFEKPVASRVETAIEALRTRAFEELWPKRMAQKRPEEGSADLQRFFDEVETVRDGFGKLVQIVIDVRAEARARKDFAQADRIRARLRELGIALEDRPEGTVWRRES